MTSRYEKIREERAAAIVELRKKAGSHEKLAKELGVSRQTVMRWEKGSYPQHHVEALLAAGVPARLLEPPPKATSTSPSDRLESLARDIRTLRLALGTARTHHTELLERVEVLEARIDDAFGQEGHATP